MLVIGESQIIFYKEMEGYMMVNYVTNTCEIKRLYTIVQQEVGL